MDKPWDYLRGNNCSDSHHFGYQMDTQVSSKEEREQKQKTHGFNSSKRSGQTGKLRIRVPKRIHLRIASYSDSFYSRALTKEHTVRWQWRADRSLSFKALATTTISDNKSDMNQTTTTNCNELRKMWSIIVDMETFIYIYVITIIFNIFMYKFYYFNIFTIILLYMNLSQKYS